MGARAGGRRTRIHTARAPGPGRTPPARQPPLPVPSRPGQLGTERTSSSPAGPASRKRAHGAPAASPRTLGRARGHAMGSARQVAAAPRADPGCVLRGGHRPRSAGALRPRLVPGAAGCPRGRPGEGPPTPVPPWPPPSRPPPPSLSPGAHPHLPLRVASSSPAPPPQPGAAPRCSPSPAHLCEGAGPSGVPGPGAERPRAPARPGTAAGPALTLRVRRPSRSERREAAGRGRRGRLRAAARRRGAGAAGRVGSRLPAACARRAFPAAPGLGTRSALAGAVTRAHDGPPEGRAAGGPAPVVDAAWEPAAAAQKRRVPWPRPHPCVLPPAPSSTQLVASGRCTGHIAAHGQLRASFQTPEPGRPEHCGRRWRFLLLEMWPPQRRPHAVCAGLATTLNQEPHGVTKSCRCQRTRLV